MKHLVVIFHFLCFATGIGCVTYVLTLFRKRKIYWNLVISEGMFSLWFLTDSIGSYLRNLVSSQGVTEIIHIIGTVLSVTGAIFFILALMAVRKAGTHYRINGLSIFFIIMTAVCLLGWIGSFFIDALREIPSLCLAFIFQCICVFIITANEIIDTKDTDCINTLTELTEREIEIVNHLISGENNKEIGEALFISPNTVRNHTYNIYKKLNVRNKIELINQIKNQD